MESDEDHNLTVNKGTIPHDRGDIQPLLLDLSNIIPGSLDAPIDQHGLMPTEDVHHNEALVLNHYKTVDTSFNGDRDCSLMPTDDSHVCDFSSNPVVHIEQSLNGESADESKIGMSHLPDIYLSTTSLLPGKTPEQDDSKTFGEESLSSDNTYFNSEKSFSASDLSAPVHFNLDNDSQQSAGELGQFQSSDEQFYADTNDSFVSLDQVEIASLRQNPSSSLDPGSPITVPESLSDTAHCSESFFQATFTPEALINCQSESPNCAVTLKLESNSQVSTPVEDSAVVEQVKPSVEAEPVEITTSNENVTDADEGPPIVVPLHSNGLDHAGSSLGSPHSAFRKWSPPIESLSSINGNSSPKSAHIILDNHTAIWSDVTTENQQSVRFDACDEELENLGNSRIIMPHTSSPVTTSIDFSRYSPAHVVAATGGASVAILRQLQSPSTGGDIRENSFIFRSTPQQQCNITEGLPVEPEAVVPPMFNITLTGTPELQPAKTEDVESCSEQILGSFLIETYRHERESHVPTQASSSYNQPSASFTTQDKNEFHGDPFGLEFARIPRAAPDSLEAQVAQRLAQLGDEIDRAYGHRLDRMIGCLPLNECPVQTFCEVARVLFSWGPTNWGQVISLFCFGYRLIIRRARSGLLDAFHQVCRCLVSFCRQVNVFAWIAVQGGWQIVRYLSLGNRDETRSSIPLDSNAPSSPTPSFPGSPYHWYWIASLAVLCTALVVYRKLAR